MGVSRLGQSDPEEGTAKNLLPTLGLEKTPKNMLEEDKGGPVLAMKPVSQEEVSHSADNFWDYLAGETGAETMVCQ